VAKGAAAVEGDWFYDTTNHWITTYTGSAWQKQSMRSNATRPYATSAAFLTADQAAGGSGAAVAGDYFYSTGTSSIQVYTGSWEETACAASVTGDVTLSASATASLGTSKVTSVHLNGHLAIGGTTTTTAAVIPTMFVVNTTGTTGEVINITLDATTAFRVTRLWVIWRAAGVSADTLQISNAGSAITSTVSLLRPDKTCSQQQTTRAQVTYDDDNWTIAPGGVLRITTTDGGAANDVPPVTAVIFGYRYA
jgi:hypothetical protein